MNPVMNDTKWRELRAAMLELGNAAPQWRTRDLKTGYVSAWDREWFYHFADGGYDNIEWLELRSPEVAKPDGLQSILDEIHLPGERIEAVLRIYGYVRDGSGVDAV